MKTTKNFFLKIFEGLDNFDYKTINENWEKIDNALDELLNGGNEVILPTITVERIENGYRITTNDAKGSQSIDLVLDDLIVDDLNKTGVVAGSYGGYDSNYGAYKIPNVTVDEYGKVTEASNSVLGFATNKGSGILSASDYSSFKSSVIKYKHGTYFNGSKFYTAFLDEAAVINVNGEYIPRILNVLMKIYIDANKTSKYWVSIPFQARTEVDSKDGSLVKLMYFKIPEEYAEYNLVEYEPELYDEWYEFEYMIEYIAA